MVRECLRKGGSRAGTVRGSCAKIWEDRERRGEKVPGRENMCQSTKAGTHLADSRDSKKRGGEDEVEGLLPEKSLSITQLKLC